MLKESSSSFIHNSSIGIHAVSAEGIIEYANQCELDTLGYQHHEYVGQHVSNFQMDDVTLQDMMKRLGNFENLQNYPAKVQGKKNVKYILYNSSVYTEDQKFVHTRCFGSEIDEGVYNVFYKRLHNL